MAVIMKIHCSEVGARWCILSDWWSHSIGGGLPIQMIFDKGRGNTTLFTTLLCWCVKTMRFPDDEKISTIWKTKSRVMRWTGGSLEAIKEVYILFAGDADCWQQDKSFPLVRKSKSASQEIEFAKTDVQITRVFIGESRKAATGRDIIPRTSGNINPIQMRNLLPNQCKIERSSENGKHFWNPKWKSNKIPPWTISIHNLWRHFSLMTLGRHSISKKH